VSTPPTRSTGAALGSRLVRVLAAARTDDAASESVLREVALALGSPLAVLWRLDEASGLLRFARDWAGGDATEELRRVGPRLTFAPGVGLPGRVLETLEPAWIPDIAADANFPRAGVALEAGLRSVVAAPLLAPDGVMGVIEFFWSDPRDPSAGEIQDATMAGRQLAAFLGRLRIEHRLHASEETSASIVHAALDCIITMDHHGRVLGFNPAAEATFGYERADAVGRPLAELIIPPGLREAHQRALEAYVRDRTATILGRRLELVGLRADGSTFPLELTVTRLGTSEPPSFAGFLRDISDRRALETEQARLLREALLARAQAEAEKVRTDDAREEAERARSDAERARERMAFLARAGREMAASLDWETTLRAVVRSAVPAVADWSSLTVVAPDGRLRVVAVAHEDPERERLAWELVERYPASPDAPAGLPLAIRTGEPQLVADITPETVRAAALDAEHLRLLESLNVRHTAIAPLRTPAGVIGAISLVLGDSDRRFTPDDLELLTSLAARAALHIQNARLYAERSHIARTLEAGLAPRALPAVEGAEIAARFLPAGHENMVGGDFYDVFASGDRVWTAIVGDVSGKGPEAAAITALARHTLRTTSMLYDDPAANLALLNRAMLRDTPTRDFCTVLYARLCPGEAGIDVRFSNAGHPPPLLLRVDGTVESVEDGRGPLVGAFADTRFAEGTLEVRPGELLLLYTDGVTEVRTSDVGLGERALRETLAASAGASADAVVDAVAQRAVELQGGAQRDDIALVAIRARVHESPPAATVDP
jgi:PAS domain S-box-containing protein